MPQSSSTLALILSILALLTGAYSVWQIVSLNKIRKTFFAGTQALNLESVILKLEAELKTGREQQIVLENALSELRQQFTFAVQKVGLVRFNPFQDGGGNFSFSLAILDEHNTGIVLTSMHGRQQNRIYTKKIDEGKSDSQLTDEEIQALTMANNKFHADKNEEEMPKKTSRKKLNK